MTDLSSTAHCTAIDKAAPRPNIRSIALQCLVVFVAGLVWQQRWGTIPDTSWVITIVERWLAGDRLYIDLYEVNPPFTVWLYAPPVVLAQALGVWPEFMVHAYTYAAVFLGLGLAAYILTRSRIAAGASLLRYAPAFLALFVIFPGMAFSEREHFGVALVLPLFALMAWRADARAPARPGLGVIILAGLAGSIIVLVKPYYALSILAPALLIAWRLRRPFFLFAAEYWIIGFTAVGYLALVQYLHPEFLTVIFPVVADTYLLMTTRLSVFLHFAIVIGPLLGLIWWMWPRGGAGDLERISLAASLASVLPLVYQGKGWSYHAYPSIAFALIVLICLLSRSGSTPAAVSTQRRKPSMTLITVFVAVAWVPFTVSQRPAFALSQRPASDLVEAVVEATDRPTVAYIGLEIAYGHPFTRMVDGVWISRHCSDWLGIFAHYLGTLAKERGDNEQAAHYRAMLETYVAEKKREFEARPDVVLVQKTEPFWTIPLFGEFGFSKILDDYRLIAEDKDIWIYLRADYREPPSD